MCEYPGCGRKFTCKSKCTTHHERVHTAVKEVRRASLVQDFKCEVQGCATKFASQGNLTRHHRNFHPALAMEESKKLMSM
jgi:hypothetical protein